MSSKQRQRELTPKIPQVVVSDEIPQDAIHRSHTPRDSQKLGNLLRIHNESRSEPKYWTEKELRYVLSRSRITRALGLESQRDKADTILTKNIRTLAILALMEKLKYLDEFLKINITDEDLPLVKCTDHPTESQISLRTATNLPLTLFEHWKVHTRESFLKLQYGLCPPLLRMKLGQRNADHEDYLEHTIMPWTSPLSEKEVGGYSQVFEVDIHPDCHDFHEILDSLSVCPLASTDRYQYIDTSIRSQGATSLQ